MTTVVTVATIPNGNSPVGMDLVRLAGLRKGKEPKWFERIRRDGFNRPGWYDHPRSDGDALVVEPYGIWDLKDLRNLVEFADKYDLDVHISGISQHYPSRTINIRLTPRKEKGAA